MYLNAHGSQNMSFQRCLWICVCFFFFACFFLPVLLGYNWHMHCMSFRYIASHFDIMSWNKDHDQLSDEYRCIWRSHRNYWFSSLVEPRSQAELYMQVFFFFFKPTWHPWGFQALKEMIFKHSPPHRFSPLFSYQVTKNTYFLCQEEV